MERQQRVLAQGCSGVGIPEDDLGFIFERFRQGDASSTRRHGGPGLGLAIAKALVEMHGGSIVAKSPGRGKGASFRVSLPLPALHDDSANSGRRHPYAGESHEMPALPRLDGLRLLVIDADADSRGILELALSWAGGTVRPAKSAAEGLIAADETAFDVLISDIGMPEMDGLEMMTKIRASEACVNREIPALALTAFAAVEDRKRALLVGFDSFLSKPVDMGEVVAVISHMARRRR